MKPRVYLLLFILLVLVSCSNSSNQSEPPSSLGFKDTDTEKSSEPNSSSVKSVSSNACATRDYSVIIPQGWFTSEKGQLNCKAFFTQVMPEDPTCDCNLSVRIEIVPDNLTNVLADLKSSSSGEVTSEVIQEDQMYLVKGSWPLADNFSEKGSRELYLYAIANFNQTILLVADEYHDFGGDSSFGDRKDAVDRIAMSLQILA